MHLIHKISLSLYLSLTFSLSAVIRPFSHWSAAQEISLGQVSRQLLKTSVSCLPTMQPLLGEWQRTQLLRKTCYYSVLLTHTVKKYMVSLSHPSRAWWHLLPLFAVGYYKYRSTCGGKHSWSLCDSCCIEQALAPFVPNIFVSYAYVCGAI